MPAYKVFLFGSQALTLDLKSLNKLSIQLRERDGHWALNALSTFPEIWEDLVTRIPKLQFSNGLQLLDELAKGFQSGSIQESLFPLPNVLLTPLTVIIQLTQYLAFLRAALPDLNDSDELPLTITNSTETLGLCSGMLSAFAAGFASSLAEVQQYGAIAVRLATLLGALVDAEEASLESDGSSMSFSVSRKGVGPGASMNEVLEKFPEVILPLLLLHHPAIS